MNPDKARRARVAKSRRAQGFPSTVTDAAALDEAAALLAETRDRLAREAAPRRRRRAS